LVEGGWNQAGGPGVVKGANHWSLTTSTDHSGGEMPQSTGVTEMGLAPTGSGARHRGDKEATNAPTLIALRAGQVTVVYSSFPG
jgi:hypothetical protein